MSNKNNSTKVSLESYLWRLHNGLEPEAVWALDGLVGHPPFAERLEIRRAKLKIANTLPRLKEFTIAQLIRATMSFEYTGCYNWRTWKPRCD